MPDGDVRIDTSGVFDMPQFLRRPKPGGGLVRLTPEDIRREALRRAAGTTVGPSGTPIQQPPIQTTQGLQKFSAGREVGKYDPIYYAPPPLLQQIGTAARQAGIPQVAGMVDMLNLIDKPGSEYRRHMTLYPEDKNLPMDKQLKRVAEMRGKTYQPTPGEFGASASPSQGMSYSDYAEGKANEYGTTALSGSPVQKPQEFDKFGATALGGTQALPQGKSRMVGSAKTTTPQGSSGAKPSATQVQSPKQGSVSTPTPTQPVSKPSQTQTSNPPTAQKQEPVAQPEPSGEALSYFRKNKTSPGWDALGTAVSLVQTSLTPEKGGLKSRAEYDRLLRGSDNFKKLDGNEQQRVRQAFAQWMNEQTMFKGKA